MEKIPAQRLHEGSKIERFGHIGLKFLTCHVFTLFPRSS